MPVDDGGASAIVVGPGVAHGQTELVGLAGRVSVEGERADSARSAAVHGFGEAGVGDDECSAVEHRVAHESVEPSFDLGAELGWLRVELGDRFRQTVTDLHLAACEGALQLVLVVAGDAQGATAGDEVHDESEDGGRRWTAVDEVAEEHGQTPLRMLGVGPVGVDVPAELAQ